MPLIDVEFALPRVVSQQWTDGTALPQSAHTFQGPASQHGGDVPVRGRLTSRASARERRDGHGSRSIAWGEAARGAGDAALLLANPSSDRVITAPTV